MILTIWGEYVVGEGGFFFREECWLINVEEMTEFGNHNFANTNDKINASKNLQWRLRSTPLMGNRLRIPSQCQLGQGQLQGHLVQRAALQFMLGRTPYSA